MSKTIVSVSKKRNSVWRIYYYDFDEDETWKFYTKKINPLLVWYYRLKKQRLFSNICDDCFNEFKFYKTRFEKTPDRCMTCEPDLFSN